MKALKQIFPRSIYRTISNHRTWSRSLEKDRWLKQHHPATLEAKHVQHTQVLPSRLELLKQLPPGSICAEVGVAEGDFSRAILNVVKPAKLFLIDLWSSNLERYSKSFELASQAVESEIQSGVAEIRRGWSWDMIASLENESLDWIYIDAAHDYESVVRDLQAALPKMKATSWITGHDYTRWSSVGINRWGVVEAVNEFCIEHDWEFRYLTNETHQHVSYAIAPMNANH